MLTACKVSAKGSCTLEAMHLEYGGVSRVENRPAQNSVPCFNRNWIIWGAPSMAASLCARRIFYFLDPGKIHTSLHHVLISAVCSVSCGFIPSWVTRFRAADAKGVAPSESAALALFTGNSMVRALEPQNIPPTMHIHILVFSNLPQPV